MRSQIDLFIACTHETDIKALSSICEVEDINTQFLLLDDTISTGNTPAIIVDTFTSSKTIHWIAEQTTADYVALFLKPTGFQSGYRCFHRLLQTAIDSGASMVYSDRYELRTNRDEEPNIEWIPVNDYQIGSVRDDFDFGGLWLVKGDALRQFKEEAHGRYKHAGLYELRLYLSRVGTLFHLSEPLYTEVQIDKRKSGEKQFDYVNPSVREAQIEMEKACTSHLQKIGAWLAPDEFDEPHPQLQLQENNEEFPTTVSVIIPVRNRVKTIADAVSSVLSQKINFTFNILIIDNHSTDGTSEIVKELSKDLRVKVLQPTQTDLGIGGCWDFALRSSHCGRYAIQLDSDDLYSETNTLSRIVEVFEKEKVAMVIGSYRIVDFSLQTLPPGVIDHKEWTPENGRNNALRINGLGAPHLILKF